LPFHDLFYLYVQFHKFLSPATVITRTGRLLKLPSRPAWPRSVFPQQPTLPFEFGLRFWWEYGRCRRNGIKTKKKIEKPNCAGSTVRRSQQIRPKGGDLPGEQAYRTGWRLEAGRCA